MNNTKKKPYNQTCHINSDKISSVIKLACCAADTSGGTTSSSIAPLTTVTTSEGRGRQNKQENYLEGLTILPRPLVYDSSINFVNEIDYDEKPSVRIRWITGRYASYL